LKILIAISWWMTNNFLYLEPTTSKNGSMAIYPSK
jgi:hypothetical protein